MNSILGNLNYVKVYLDDILIHFETEKDHLIHIETVLKILKSNGLSINTNKSKFFKKSVKYLGSIVSAERIKPDTQKMEETIFQEPKTLKHLQRILGFLNYFRPFIPNFSKKTL